METKKTFKFDPEVKEYIIKIEPKRSFLDKLLGREIQISEKPREGCRAFFSGLLVSDEPLTDHISRIYEIDECSEYVGEGQYPNNEKAFPKAVSTTFDGIAIDRNTRVIIYSKKNFKGEVLLDETGPAIINNVVWKRDRRICNFIKKTYIEPLQSNFPSSCRRWSNSNMTDWSKGSVKIICIECNS